MSVSGDVIIKATSQDYIRWQLLEEDGVTPISLVAATSVKLRLKDKITDAVIEFKSDDDPQKFFIVDAATGLVELRPAAGDFTSIASYSFQSILVDSIGEHYNPEDKNYTLQVLDNYPPA